MLRGQKPRKNPEEITLPQWIAAQARILKKMINGQASTEAVLDYLEYTIQFGDYAQLYSEPSMMVMDDAHRRRIHEEGGRWQDISNHHFRFFLRPRATPGTGGSSIKSARKTGGSVQEPEKICYDYNKEKCQFPNCKYRHVCLTCKGSHPQTRHDAAPPRFRGPKEDDS